MSRPRRRIVWPVLVVLTLLLIGGCGLFAFTTCHPPELVAVSITNIPPGTRFLSLAALTDKGPVSMLWSEPGALGISSGGAIHPATTSLPEGYHPGPAGEYDYGALKEGLWFPYWKRGEKYGVVMQTMKGEWRVAWFPASEVPIQGLNWLGSEGRVEFDLSKVEIVLLGLDTVKALGLQDVKPFVK